jgi:hypothetical protein
VSRKKSVTGRDVDCNVTFSTCMGIMFFRVFALKVNQVEQLQRRNLAFRPSSICTKFVTLLHCEIEEIQNKRGTAFLFAVLGREISLIVDVSREGIDNVVKNRYENTFKNKTKKISAKFK